MLKRWKTDEDSSIDKLGKIQEMLSQQTTDEGNIKDKLGKIEEILRQLWKDESNKKDKLGKMEDSFDPAEFIDTIRKLYKIREGWLAPYPWCEEFRFHLDNIFTRLKMVSRKKERGTKTDKIVNMFDIFKPHEECKRPRTVLIEGDPGIGKTTYCQKLAYDWAIGRQEGSSFQEFEVMLLLRCREIKSDFWEAIDDQLLPLDVTEGDREKFFQFVRHNQSNVLLVLDGLDELPSGKLPMFKEIIQGRMLPKCHLVVTARHEAGIKVRECCDTLLEIEGFEAEDAKQFIVNYFKTMKNLGQKLLHNLDRDESLRNLTANPLNTALLCLLCEDFNGIFPESRTHIFLEIMQCVLRRYRRKKELPETDEDLTEKHKAELRQLGNIALNGLLENDMYFEASLFRDRTSDIPGFGFLSVQPGSSKRRPSLRYGFLHKNFQELFAAFYLCCQLLDGKISATSLVADGKYWSGLKQVLLFAVGMVALQSEEKAAEVIKSMVSQVNKNERNDFLLVALECINECKKEKSDLHKKLARLCGSLLQMESVSICGAPHAAASMTEALKTNSTITVLLLENSEINGVGCIAMAEVLKSNSTVTQLHLSSNKIGDEGATAIAEVLKSNSTLTLVDLFHNEIGDVGATAMAEVLKSNSTLTELHLSGNRIGDVGATAMAEVLKSNSTLTELYLFGNKIGDEGATAIAEVLKSSSTLTQVDLYGNKIGDVGATAMAEVLKSNSSLTMLHLFDNKIGDVGATAIAEVLKSNSTLTDLDLSGNKIGDVGATAMAEVLKTHSTCTKLNLTNNNIGDDGRAALHQAVTINTTIQVEWEHQRFSDSETDGDSDDHSDGDSVVLLVLSRF